MVGRAVVLMVGALVDLMGELKALLKDVTTVDWKAVTLVDEKVEEWAASSAALKVA